MLGVRIRMGIPPPVRWLPPWVLWFLLLLGLRRLPSWYCFSYAFRAALPSASLMSLGLTMGASNSSNDLAFLRSLAFLLA